MPPYEDMPRHSYSLSDETIRVLSGKVQPVAEEWDVIDKHVYAILAGTYTDPFAVFHAMYAAAIRAGCDVSHWDEKLKATRSKYASLSHEANGVVSIRADIRERVKAR